MCRCDAFIVSHKSGSITNRMSSLSSMEYLGEPDTFRKEMAKTYVMPPKPQYTKPHQNGWNPGSRIWEFRATAIHPPTQHANETAHEDICLYPVSS